MKGTAPGSANLPIGGLQGALQENDVPGLESAYLPCNGVDVRQIHPERMLLDGCGGFQ